MLPGAEQLQILLSFARGAANSRDQLRDGLLQNEVRRSGAERLAGIRQICAPGKQNEWNVGDLFARKRKNVNAVEAGTGIRSEDNIRPFSPDTLPKLLFVSDARDICVDFSGAELLPHHLRVSIAFFEVQDFERSHINRVEVTAEAKPFSRISFPHETPSQQLLSRYLALCFCR